MGTPNPQANRRKRLHLLIPIAAVILLLCFAGEVGARGGGGRGGSRYRGGGGGGYQGRVARGGPAQGGSIENSRASGGYRAYDGGGQSGRRNPSGRANREAAGGYADGGERSGSFETRPGETVDHQSTVTKTDDGYNRESSWSSTSGASGGGSANINTQNGQVQSTDRSGHAESASGETMSRDVQSQRDGNSVDRQSPVKSSTGVDAQSEGTITKTEGGFVAQGAVAGERGAAAGTLVRSGNQTYVRGVATDGNTVTHGAAHCNGSNCYGGRVVAPVGSYYHSTYYYYPYNYYWYSCPYGSVNHGYNQYGAPVYSCSSVVVVHTTIYLGSSSTSSSSTSQGFAEADEAKVSSAPVLMYEVSSDAVVYATIYMPSGVYAMEKGGFYYWVPGPAEASDQAKDWIAAAEKIDQATANSTVITYTADGRTIYLTNERPAPGFYSETADHLFVWIPGVSKPTDADKALVTRVISAHKNGGQSALDREVRKLEKNKEPPPETQAAAKPTVAEGPS